ncbi:TPA: hypothetical protein ACVEY8_000650 [Yersinia enterocolitica]|nr:hypothetical protein [Yersinia enterocolitica]
MNNGHPAASDKELTTLIDHASHLVGDAARRIFMAGEIINSDTLTECLVDDLTLAQVKKEKYKVAALELALQSIQHRDLSSQS